MIGGESAPAAPPAERSELACLQIDDSGRLSLRAAQPYGTPTATARAVCADLSWLVAIDATPVVARSVPGATGGPAGERDSFGGLVTLRDVSDGDVAFHTATAVAATEAEAVAMATLAAFDANDDLLTAIGRYIAAYPGVVGVTVVDAGGVRFAVGDSAAHVALVDALPAPGRLVAATDDEEHRVLCLPSAALVVTIKPTCGLEPYLEETFARVERAVLDRDAHASG